MIRKSSTEVKRRTPSQDDVAAFSKSYKQGRYNMVASNGQLFKEKTQKIPPKPTVLSNYPKTPVVLM